MFTGIVQATSKVVSIEKQSGLNVVELDIEPSLTQGLKTGASVAVNGVCLTVIKQKHNSVFFDVMEETLTLTNLKNVEVGNTVNVERSLTFGSEIGGHILSGHVHTQAKVIDVSDTAEHYDIKMEISAEWIKFVMYKGFIAINGCSLTVGKIEGQQFMIHLIPETLRMTNLGQYQIGDCLNIEIDSQTQTIVNTVERILEAKL